MASATAIPTIQDVDQKINVTNTRVAELVRKSRGITRANARAASLERTMATIITSLESLKAREVALGSNAGPEQKEAFMAELSRIDKKLDGLWSDLNAQLEKLVERVDGHDKRLDGHDELFAGLDADNQERDGRIGIIGTSVAHAHARIDVLQQARNAVSTIHPAAYVAGAIAGIVAGFLWGDHNWSQEAVVNGAKVVVENTAANSLWAAIVCGVAVALFVVFVVSLFVKNDDNHGQTTQVTAATSARAQSRVEIDRGAPTQVHPVLPPPPPPPPAPVASQTRA